MGHVVSHQILHWYHQLENSLAVSISPFIYIYIYFGSKKRDVIVNFLKFQFMPVESLFSDALLITIFSTDLSLLFFSVSCFTASIFSWLGYFVPLQDLDLILPFGRKPYSRQAPRQVAPWNRHEGGCNHGAPLTAMLSELRYCGKIGSCTCGFTVVILRRSEEESPLAMQEHCQKGLGFPKERFGVFGQVFFCFLNV